MGFEQLKSKLAGKEDGYPVTEETVQEWANMSVDDKKVLIAEAKEKGGAWRESLLKLDEATKMRTGPKGDAAASDDLTAALRTGPRGARAVGGDLPAASAALRTSPRSASGLGAKTTDTQHAVNLAAKEPSDNPLAIAARRAGEAGGKAANWASEHKGELAGGTAAALAAGLGAVALAKKMRGSKKK